MNLHCGIHRVEASVAILMVAMLHQAANFLENACIPGIPQSTDCHNAYSFAVLAARQLAHGIQNATSAAIRIFSSAVASVDGTRHHRSFRRRAAPFAIAPNSGTAAEWDVGPAAAIADAQGVAESCWGSEESNVGKLRPCFGAAESAAANDQTIWRRSSSKHAANAE